MEESNNTIQLNNIASYANNICDLTNSKMPVKHLCLKDNNDNWRLLVPKEDITTFELSHIMILFLHGTANVQRTSYYYDYWGYVEQHNLERHFDYEKK